MGDAMMARRATYRALPRYLPDVWAEDVMMAHQACCGQRIKCEQDVLTGDCRVTIVQCRAAGHSQCIATVPDRPTTWCHTAHRHDVARRRDRTILVTIEDIISYF
jgi:hypothetical protein